MEGIGLFKELLLIMIVVESHADLIQADILGTIMSKKNAFYAQSGGVTAVINATACAVIETARRNKRFISNVYAGRNGILGALTENMIDTNKETNRTIAALKYTPGGAFGSARYKLKSIKKTDLNMNDLLKFFVLTTLDTFFTMAVMIPWILH